VSLVEKSIQPTAEGGVTTTELDERRHVVRHTQRVFRRQSLVEEGVPPRDVPWCHLRVGTISDLRAEDLRVPPLHRVKPPATGIPWHDESFHAAPFIVLAPKVLPRTGAVNIPFIYITLAKSFGHLRDAPVVVAVLHGAGTCARYAIGHIAQPDILPQSAASFLLVVCGRHIAVLEHSLQRLVIVDTFQSAGVSFGNHHVGMGASLRAPVAVTAACVGHVTFVAVDGQERTDDTYGPFGVVLHEQGHRRAIGVPQRIEVVVVGCTRPSRTLAGFVHRHEQGMIECGIEDAAFTTVALIRHARQCLLPLLPQQPQLRVEVMSDDVAAGLRFRHVRDAHLDLHHRVSPVDGGATVGEQPRLDKRRTAL